MDFTSGPFARKSPLVPWASVKTWWSDDTVTEHGPMPYIWCQIDLAIYADRPFWQDQVRPVRAVIIDVFLWHDVSVCLHEHPGVECADSRSRGIN